ncbi:hypothetical protein GCM10027200_33860 [Lentzea nigeriaca]
MFWGKVMPASSDTTTDARRVSMDLVFGSMSAQVVSTRVAAILRGTAERRCRLLVIEPVLPDAVQDAASPAVYLSDLNMLVNLGGKERTRAEFEALLIEATPS